MSEHRPLITSGTVLRGVATAMTFVSTIGMTAFAATHVQNSAAPLQPSAATTLGSVAGAPTPSPQASSATRRTTRSSLATTTRTAITKTHSS